MTQTWKTVRIFISSTFRDMHAERDHLVKVVFPELRERCEKQQLHLIDIDLLGKKNADGKNEPLPRRPWTQFYLAAENALAQRASLLNFGHDYLRAAVQRRYLASDADARSFQLQLADYFRSINESTDWKIDELPALLRDTAQWESLKNLLAYLPTFERLREHQRWKWELHEFWLAIGERYDPVEVYHNDMAARPERALRLAEFLRRSTDDAVISYHPRPRENR